MAARNKVPVPRRSDISDVELAWLAGLLEGEGSFRYMWDKRRRNIYIHITLTMVDYDVVKRAASIMKSFIRMPAVREDRQQTYQTVVTGTPALAWIQLLREHMGVRRQAQIDACIDIYHKTAKIKADFVLTSLM